MIYNSGKQAGDKMVKFSKNKKLGSECIQLELFQKNCHAKEIEEITFFENNNQGIEEGVNLSNFSEILDNKHTSEAEKIITMNDINGLTYIRNFISKSEHDLLLQRIDSEPWLTELQRRVQHYGYKYDYAKHQISRSMYIAPLPDWSLGIAQRLHQSYSPTLPDQVIVNEYEPGQGIAKHTDCRTCFRDTIISLSLCSPSVMDFTNNKKGVKRSILLEPRSLIVLKGEARYEWAHGIAKRKSDKFQGRVFKRTRRVSLTFRTVILPD